MRVVYTTREVEIPEGGECVCETFYLIGVFLYHGLRVVFELSNQRLVTIPIEKTAF